MAKKETRTAVQKKLFPLSKMEIHELETKFAALGIQRLKICERFEPVEAKWKSDKQQKESTCEVIDSQMDKIARTLRGGEKERNVETKASLDAKAPDLPGLSKPARKSAGNGEAAHV